MNKMRDSYKSYNSEVLGSSSLNRATLNRDYAVIITLLSSPGGVREETSSRLL